MFSGLISEMLSFKAPSNILRVICNRLASRLIEDGEQLSGAFPAVIGGNLELFADSVSSLPLSDRILLGITLRNLVGMLSRYN